jgi:hypothetical protein
MKKLLIGLVLIGVLFAEAAIPAEFVKFGSGAMGSKHFDVTIVNISNDYCIFIDKDNARWIVTAPFEIKFKQNEPAK